MHGHSVMTMTMGQGSIYSNLTKQKLVAWSSTESELTDVHDALPQILWMHKLLMAQGHNRVDNVLFQDNKSAILLEENGRKTSSKHMKHITE